MKHILLFLIALSVLAAIFLRIRYGGGEPFDDVSTSPALVESALEVVLSYPEPIGNVAVNSDGRVFFTVHPESRPQGNKLLEWVSGAAVPFPSGSAQPQLFDTVLGLVIDRQNRLWTIDHGNHGFGNVRLLALSLDDGSVLHDKIFDRRIAPYGSFLQDIQVSKDGDTVFIADASIWRKTPAIVVYDVATQSARRVLESHASVSANDILIRNPIKNMQFAGGTVSLKTGVDGLSIDSDNAWLYFAAMNSGDLFRIGVSDLTNRQLTAQQLEAAVEKFSAKPLSDGLSSDIDGNVYVTDVEHGAVFIVDQSGKLRTLIQSPKIRWADGLSFGPDGWLYLADSALPELVLKSKEHIRSRRPYYIFRFQPGHLGNPGH